MAATQTVPQHLKHCNFIEITPRSGAVTLFGYGIQVQVDRGHLTLCDGIGIDRRHARLPRVGHKLRRLVVVGSDGMVSLAALRWLADQDAAFVMLDRDGSVLLTTGPVRPSDARLRRAQSLAHDSGAALKIALELIWEKLVRQERLVRKQLQNDDAADIIARARQALTQARSSDEIRKHEAHAALAYWSTWHALPVSFSPSDLRRVPEHWQTFGSRMSPLTRSPRLAVNPVNAMLNYLYAVLESEARLAICELGLDPGIGVLHNDTRARDSLACDLMEPIRPQVDAYVLDWLRRSPLQRKWFFEQRDGNCRLTADFVGELSETSRMWRHALAPFAEWIAHTLWSVCASPSAKSPAARLTQNRKREAKGIPVKSYPTVSKRPTGLSRNSGLTVSRELRFVFQEPAHLNRRDPIAKSRRSEAQRRQAVAMKSWKSSDKPEWLGEEFYRDRVQPLLSRFETTAIQKALSISRTYASRIRLGQCVPHQRHWTRLSALVGLLCSGS